MDMAPHALPNILWIVGTKHDALETDGTKKAEQEL